MATTTPNFGWSVPTSTDYVKDGATNIETLGDAIDGRFGDITNFPNQIVNRVSSVSRPVAYAMQAGSATSTTSGVTVTFTASRFTQTPLVTATTINGSLGNTNPAIVTVGTISTSSAVLWVTGGGVQVAGAVIHYHAVQMKSATAAG
jgi:hypothetical protein